MLIEKGKHYRKTALLEVLAVTSTRIFVQNVGNPEDQWFIPTELFQSTYEAVQADKPIESDRDLAKAYEGKRFDFSTALRLLKMGARVARAGWNGKGMFIAMQQGYPQGIPINRNTAEATGIPEGTVCKFRPYFTMKTADAEATFFPMVPTISDILSDDWFMVV